MDWAIPERFPLLQYTAMGASLANPSEATPSTMSSYGIFSAPSRCPEATSSIVRTSITTVGLSIIDQAVFGSIFFAPHAYKKKLAKTSAPILRYKASSFISGCAPVAHERRPNRSFEFLYPFESLPLDSVHPQRRVPQRSLQISSPYPCPNTP